MRRDRGAGACSVRARIKGETAKRTTSVYSEREGLTCRDGEERGVSLGSVFGKSDVYIYLLQEFLRVGGDVGKHAKTGDCV